MENMRALLNREGVLDYFFLPTFEAAEAFARSQHEGTGRTTFCFTEDVGRFTLNVVGITQRPRPVVATIMGGTRYNRVHGHLVPEENAA
jgi:hypothetical protein